MPRIESVTVQSWVALEHTLLLVYLSFVAREQLHGSRLVFIEYISGFQSIVRTVVCQGHLFDISKVGAQVNMTTTVFTIFPSFRGRRRLKKLKLTALATDRYRGHEAQG